MFTGDASMVDSLTPSIAQREVRASLREARADRPCDEVAMDLKWSLLKLLRVEQGCRPPRVDDLLQILTHYGVDDSVCAALVALTKRAASEGNRWA